MHIYLVGKQMKVQTFGIWRVALTLRESENMWKSEKKKQEVSRINFVLHSYMLENLIMNRFSNKIINFYCNNLGFISLAEFIMIVSMFRGETEGCEKFSDLP